MPWAPAPAPTSSNPNLALGSSTRSRPWRGTSPTSRRAWPASSCKRSSARAGSRDPASGVDRLTPREREVAQLLVEGMSSRAVAGRLSITAKTVDTHRSAILRKLGLSSMADLVRYAIRQRLVEP